MNDVKSNEDTAKQPELTKWERAYQEEGLPNKEAEKKAKSKVAWNVAKRHNATDTHVSLTKERERLDKWRADGKPEHSAPWTA